MAFGIEVTMSDGFTVNFAKSCLSVIASGTLPANTGNATSVIVINKSQHPDVTEYQLVFIPTGIRSTSTSEVRPTLHFENSSQISILKGAGMSVHQYLVLGR